MNDRDRRELRNLIKREVAKRGKSIVDPNSWDHRVFRILRNVTIALGLFFLSSDIVLCFAGIKSFDRDSFNRHVVIGVLHLFFSGFLHYVTRIRTDKAQRNREKWHYQNGLKAAAIFLMGYVGAAFYITTRLPPNSILGLVVVFMLCSSIGYYIFVAAIAVKPKYFLNRSITRTATFLRLVIVFSASVFVLLVARPEIDLLHPDLVQYITSVFYIVVPPLVIMDRLYNVSDEKLDMAQLHILSFYPPSRILSCLTSERAVKASEMEALRLFLKLEEEGDDHKERALLTHLSNKYGTKEKGPFLIVFTAISFISVTVIEALVQYWLFGIVNDWVKHLWALIMKLLPKF